MWSWNQRRSRPSVIDRQECALSPPANHTTISQTVGTAVSAAVRAAVGAAVGTAILSPPANHATVSAAVGQTVGACRPSASQRPDDPLLTRTEAGGWAAGSSRS